MSGRRDRGFTTEFARFQRGGGGLDLRQGLAGNEKTEITAIGFRSVIEGSRLGNFLEGLALFKGVNGFDSFLLRGYEDVPYSGFLKGFGGGDLLLIGGLAGLGRNGCSELLLQVHGTQGLVSKNSMRRLKESRSLMPVSRAASAISLCSTKASTRSESLASSAMSPSWRAQYLR